jgi:hypothetical protein
MDHNATGDLDVMLGSAGNQENTRNLNAPQRKDKGHDSKKLDKKKRIAKWQKTR